MNVNKILKGLDLIREALLEEQNVPVQEPVQQEIIKEKKALGTANIAEGVAVPVEEPKKSESAFEGVSYNELKSLASENKLSSTGTREAIISRLVERGIYRVPKNENPKETENPAETKKAETLSPIPPADLTTEDIVNKAVEGMSNEEIASILSDIGVTPTGKRQALISKVIKAVDDGKLVLEDDGESTVETSEPVEVPKTEESAEDEEDLILNEENDYVINKDIAPERVKAIEEFIDTYSDTYTEAEIIEALGLPKNAKLTTERITNFINEALLLIDDEGVMHEPEEPYELNGMQFCCGKELSHNKRTKAFTCSVCNSNYEEE